ncbi:hypothetical protein LCGC14_0359490 [marine sediment metagenome]|uniref:Uncharacterized protein n=1 Tax=marine sediment metagenome TaxID=412755 RepID=A0A0F9TE86_9ZZZZ|nr:hypothetical protein [Candidatus Aminicenantes bacterium]
MTRILANLPDDMHLKLKVMAAEEKFPKCKSIAKLINRALDIVYGNRGKNSGYTVLELHEDIQNKTHKKKIRPVLGAPEPQGAEAKFAKQVAAETKKVKKIAAKTPLPFRFVP